MAYGNYFPATYQPNYYGQPNPYYQQMQNQAMMQQAQAAQAQQQAQAQQMQAQQMQQQTIQQSGFVLVQSEQEARAYPVAPGNSITFKDERQPYCYVKTMGFNQLDQPTFERYRLVKEDTPAESIETHTTADSNQTRKDIPYALKSDIESLRGEIDALKEKISAQPSKKTNKNTKYAEEVGENDE